MGYRVCFARLKTLEICHTIMCIQVVLLYCTLKNGYNGKFYVAFLTIFQKVMREMGAVGCPSPSPAPTYGGLLNAGCSNYLLKMRKTALHVMN